MPRYRGQPPSAALAIEQMVAATVACGYDVRVPPVFGSANAARARNISLTRVRPDADYVLFCDDDMAPGQDALVRLVAHGLPVVSGICTTREIPPRVACSVFDIEGDRFARMARIKMNRLVQPKQGEPLAAGAAFLLVQKPVLDRVIEYHLSAHDWLELNRRTLDRLSVRAERRENERKRIEEKRRALWESERLLKVFQFSIEGNETERGEDYHFCRLLIALGVPLAIDTGCIVPHVGEFAYSVHLLGVERWEDVRFEDDNERM